MFKKFNIKGESIQNRISNIPIEKTKTIAEEQIAYYKSIRDPKELEKVSIDILRAMYLDALDTIDNLNDFKKEHSIMKRFICINGLWNKFLNDDLFINYLRDEWKGE